MKPPATLIPPTQFGAVLIVILCILGSLGTAMADETEDQRNSGISVPTAAPQKQRDFFAFDRENEQYFGVFGGNASLAGAQVTATYHCLFCKTISGSQNFQFEKGSVAGIRWGIWVEYFGFALELSSTHASSKTNTNGSTASVRYTSISMIPMLRMPLYKTDSMPGGRLNLYGGFGLSFDSGNVDVSIPGQPPISGGTQKSNTGTVALIGVSLRYPRFILFAERRATDTSLNYDGSVDNFSLSPYSTVTVPINMSETVVGVQYRF